MTAALLLLLTTAAPAGVPAPQSVVLAAAVEDTVGAPEAEHRLRFFGAVEEEIRDGDDTSSSETAAPGSRGGNHDASSCSRRRPCVDAWRQATDEVSAHAARGPPRR